MIFAAWSCGNSFCCLSGFGLEGAGLAACREQDQHKTRRRSLEAQNPEAQGDPWASPLTPSLLLGPQDERGPCARAVEQFHHASLLSHLQRGEEQAQVMTQAMAELATAPYLQRVSQEDEELVGFDSQRLFWLTEPPGLTCQDLLKIPSLPPKLPRISLEKK